MKQRIQALAETRVVKAFRGVASGYGDRQTGDKAASLTYFAILAVFPGLIVIAGLLGLLGNQGTIDGLLRIIKQLAPGSASGTFEGPAKNLVEGGGAGFAVVIGIAVALYSASGYVGAFIRASNSIYEVEETRGIKEMLPRQVLLTFFLLAALSIALLALLLTGPLARAIFDEIGVGDTALTIWSVLKWPVLFVIVSSLFAVLLHRGPNVPNLRFRELLPGAFLATSVWILASAGFAAYVANFGKYASTYGSLAGVVVFLLWIWISNIALLIGTAFNVELRKSAPVVVRKFRQNPVASTD
ncbi:N/A [soil metagenome]